MFDEAWETHQGFAIRSMRWIDLKKGLNNERQVIRVGVRDPCKLSSYHFLEQS